LAFFQIQERFHHNVFQRHLTRFAKKSIIKPEYIDSTTATTASSENNLQYQNITTASRGDILGRSNTLRKEFSDAGIPLPANINKKGAISEEKMDQLRKQYKDRIAFTASGLRKRKSKKYKK